MVLAVLVALSSEFLPVAAFPHHLLVADSIPDAAVPCPTE